MNTIKKTALITGASKGFGFELALALANKGWKLIINSRNASILLKAQRKLEKITEVVAISGDVRDEIHLLQFPERLNQLDWKLDLVVNNASTLGASPQPPLLDYDINSIHNIFHTNVIAPLSLIQKLQPNLSPNATIINISSDAAINAYEGWGGYSASKAALDHMTDILGKENPNLRVFSFDPGDMRTDLHQAAFPNENIEDRPLPKEIAVPSILQLIDNQSIKTGRHIASEVKTNPIVNTRLSHLDFKYNHLTK